MREWEQKLQQLKVNEVWNRKAWLSGSLMHKIWWWGPLRACVWLSRERKEAARHSGQGSFIVWGVIYSHVGMVGINKYVKLLNLLKFFLHGSEFAICLWF